MFKINEDIKESSKSIFVKLVLAVIITFLLITATVLGTVKVMDYRESVLIEQDREKFNSTVEDQLGPENFSQLHHIEQKAVTTSTYYKKDGTVMIEKEEVSETTKVFNP